MIMEEWQPINEFPDYYASDLGRIKRIRNNGEHYILRHKIDRYGYPVVCICSNGIEYSLTVHRLVAKAFLTNKEGKKQINHLDGNKSNNFLTNLEWATESENIKHAYKMGLIVHFKKQVLDIGTGVVFESIKEAYDSYPKKYGKGHLENMLNGKKKNKTNYILV